MIGLQYIVQSSELWKRFAAWHMNAEYLGTGGVVLQPKSNDCGPAALKMVLDHYLIPVTLDEIENRVGLTQHGASMDALKQIAQLSGLQAEAWQLTLRDFLNSPLPAIIFVRGIHFIVADSVKDGEVFCRDPSVGRLKMPSEKLPKIWNGETLVFKKPEK